MKKKLTNCFFIILFITLFACSNKKDINPNHTTMDRSTNSQSSHSSTNNTNELQVNTEINIDPNASPENVVKTIIRAGKTGNYAPLLKLCNESVDMDGDAKDICNIINTNSADQKEFNDFYGNAIIIGQTRIRNGIAEVDIQTTAQNGKKETIVVQQKYDKWYLKGF